MSGVPLLPASGLFANGGEICELGAARCGVSALAVLKYHERCCPVTAAELASVAQYVRYSSVVWVVRVAGRLSVFAAISPEQRIPAALDPAAVGSGSRMSWPAGWYRRNRLLVANGTRWTMALLYTCWCAMDMAPSVLPRESRTRRPLRRDRHEGGFGATQCLSPVRAQPRAVGRIPTATSGADGRSAGRTQPGSDPVASGGSMPESSR